MTRLKSILLSSILGLSAVSMVSCTKDFEDINDNPNSPYIAPTYTLFNGANRNLMSFTRDGWWMARMSMPWMQYSAQNIYLEEDKYQYRDRQTVNGWTDQYRSAKTFKDIILLCESADTKVQMAEYGDLDNQIALSRIMLVYIFDNLVSHFGPIPYWSYGGRDNPDFQALDIDKYPLATYVLEQDIYIDLLKELKEAAEQINEDKLGFSKGDQIYKGDVKRWKKFANSLRLRIANRIKHVYPAASAEITDAIQKGVFASNADNAVHAFGASDAEANPLWRTFYAGTPRTDFWPNRSFVQLLKGEVANFGFDPRLYKVAAPKGLTFKAYSESGYTNSSDMDDYIGMPYGLENAETYYSTASNVNIFAKEVLTANRGEVLMEYAEVEFILSEINGWDQGHYEKGVKANMDRLGVSDDEVTKFMANLPAANERNVLNQKYIMHFFNPDEAWNEYRRTGFPDTEILLMPGEVAKRPHDGSEYTFKPLQTGNVVATDLPARVRYPFTQQSLNGSNWKVAADAIGGDEIDRKLWFAKK